MSKNDKETVFTHNSVDITPVKKLEFIDKNALNNIGIWEYDRYVIAKIPQNATQTFAQKYTNRQKASQTSPKNQTNQSKDNYTCNKYCRKINTTEIPGQNNTSNEPQRQPPTPTQNDAQRTNPGNTSTLNSHEPSRGPSQEDYIWGTPIKKLTNKTNKEQPAENQILKTATSAYSKIKTENSTHITNEKREHTIYSWNLTLNHAPPATL